MKTLLKRSSILPVMVTLLLVVAGGCSSNVWDELPQSVSSFVAQYFPGQSVSKYSEIPGGCRVELNKGATLTFDSNEEWTEISGNGNTLPEVMVYDQLPPAVYQFLEEMEDTRQVYKIERTRATYVVTLPDTYVTYDTETGAITYPNADAAS